MAFWEDFRTSVSSTLNKAAEKTEDFAVSTKKKINLKAEEDRLDELYSQVGKLVYIQLRKGEDRHETIETLFSEIDDKRAKINKLRAETSNSSKIKFCMNCGAEIPADSVFCGKCGEKQE